MIVKQYIKDFEKLGLGMFVHFGLYSIIGQGEWALNANGLDCEEYNSLITKFNPHKDWARRLVRTAKNAGCKYITLTTRHHDGFSLYDNCGLNDFDAPHSKCGRDIVKEFVEECRKEDIIPFFYHTLLDWYNKDYENNFKEYLKYLRKSVEIICKNYGKIGGIWFDGMWNKPDADWEEDLLYQAIRKYQPEAMIINNTGLSKRGELGNIELDSVTFERGKPEPINLDESPKYIASEMCEIFGDHWGYAKDDLFYKSPAKIIEELCECRKSGSNMLINVGPMGNGLLRTVDKGYMELLGQWMKYFEESVRVPRPCDIKIINKEKDFILFGNNNYYLFCFEIPMSANKDVAINREHDYDDIFMLDKKIDRIYWMDNSEEVDFKQKNSNVTVRTLPYNYGRNLVVRVAKIETAG